MPYHIYLYCKHLNGLQLLFVNGSVTNLNWYWNYCPSFRPSITLGPSTGMVLDNKMKRNIWWVLSVILKMVTNYPVTHRLLWLIAGAGSSSSRNNNGSVTADSFPQSSVESSSAILSFQQLVVNSCFLTQPILKTKDFFHIVSERCWI